MQNLKIDHVQVVLGATEKDGYPSLGTILYQGDIEKIEDVSHVEIDTHTNTINVAFQDNHREELVKISPDNISNVIDIKKQFAENQNEPEIGLFATTKDMEIDGNKAYMFPALII